MIDLTFGKPHRSILTFPPASLPDFTVITGINGSGKSHLLEAIKSGAIRINQGAIKGDDIRLFTWTSMVPGNSVVVDPIALSKTRNTFIKSIADQLATLRHNVINEIEGLQIDVLPVDRIDYLLSAEGAAEIDKLQHNASLLPKWQRLKSIIQQFNKSINKAIRRNEICFQSLTEFAERNGIGISALTFADIDAIIPLNLNAVDIFQQTFSEIFAGYYRAREENRNREFFNNEYGEINTTLSQDEFTTRFGRPPWELVDKILQNAELDFTITRPTGRAEVSFEAKLLNRTSNVEIPFQDLSSGEKIIMSFALCLYNVNAKVPKIHCPKLILLDEIDAPLHPSMTRALIRVINQVLVKEMKVSVVLATHSPATVALTPEESLFRLEKTPRGLVSCSRDQAIQALTSGYISVTDSSRFVLTEDRFDQSAYTRIAEKLVQRGKLPASPNLVFVPGSNRVEKISGGSTVVTGWATKLQEAGLTNVFGLIDRDTENLSSATVKVLGRYSLENYLLDPIIIYATLMHQGRHTNVFDAGIDGRNYFELRNADESVLQQIVEHIETLIENHEPTLKKYVGHFEVEYVSGKRISARTWLRDYRGHDLVAAVRETFKEIAGLKCIVTRDQLVDLVDMVAEMPEFLPEELIVKFKSLQSACDVQ